METRDKLPENATVFVKTSELTPIHYAKIFGKYFRVWKWIWGALRFVPGIGRATGYTGNMFYNGDTYRFGSGDERPIEKPKPWRLIGYTKGPDTIEPQLPQICRLCYREGPQETQYLRFLWLCDECRNKAIKAGGAWLFDRGAFADGRPDPLNEGGEYGDS